MSSWLWLVNFQGPFDILALREVSDLMMSKHSLNHRMHSSMYIKFHSENFRKCLHTLVLLMKNHDPNFLRLHRCPPKFATRHPTFDTFREYINHSNRAILSWRFLHPSCTIGEKLHTAALLGEQENPSLRGTGRSGRHRSSQSILHAWSASR